MVFSDRLQGLTASNGLFKKQVAEGVGLPFMTYRRYASGEREPNASIVASLAKFFRVSSDYLLGLSDEPQLPTEEERAIIKAYRAGKAAKREGENF